MNDILEILNGRQLCLREIAEELNMRRVDAGIETQLLVMAGKVRTIYADGEIRYALKEEGA